MLRPLIRPLIFPTLTLSILSLFGLSSSLNDSRAMAEDVTGTTPWTVLFDGSSTDQFRNYRQDELNEKWKIIDGALVKIDKKAGDIVTKSQYGAFELELEFRISEAGNSGLMYHVLETSGPPWHTGPEVQIQDNLAGHDPQKCGWLYQLYAADVDATKPAGQWNTLRILITPEKCEHFVNGVKYVEYVKGNSEWDERVAASKFSKFDGFGKSTRGHICLQDHGDEVAYRNIRIRDLDGANQ